MKLSAAIHQPEHMPWGGFFNKMNKCDVFVVLDSVQFTKNNWQNRNQFIDHQGKRYWLTVPVKLKNHTIKTFREMEIADDDRWKRKYLNSLRSNYARTPFFQSHMKAIEEIISRPCRKLIDLNMSLINYFRAILGIKNQLIFASSLKATGNKDTLLIEICKKLGATSYISGEGAKAYLNPLLFKQNGIDLIFNGFNSNKKITGFFHPNVSTLDILFRNDIQTTMKYVFT